MSVVSSPTAALISDSVVTSSIDGGIAVLAGSDAMPVRPVKLRNVTAVASGSSSTGLGALSNLAGSAGTLDALNVIARGTANGTAPPPPTPPPKPPAQLPAAPPPDFAVPEKAGHLLDVFNN